MAQDLVM